MNNKRILHNTTKLCEGEIMSLYVMENALRLHV